MAKQILVYLHEREYQALKAYARAHNLTLDQALNKLLRAYIEGKPIQALKKAAPKH